MYRTVTRGKYFCSLYENYHLCIQNKYKSDSVTSRKFYEEIISSPVRDLSIPEIPLHEFVFEEIRKYPNKIAVECLETRRKYSYDEVYKKCCILSTNLKKILGSQKEKPIIAVILPNIPEYCITVLAASQANAIVKTINALLNLEEISYQLTLGKPNVIVTTTNLWPTISRSLQISNMPHNLPTIIVDTNGENGTPSGTINFHEFCATCHFPNKESAGVHHDDAMFHFFSSGTTGLPKAVELTHYNVVANLCQAAHPLFDFSRKAYGNFQDIVPACMPFAHSFGLVVTLLHNLCNGTKIITVPKFSSQAFKNVSQTYKPTVLNTVSNMIFMITRNQDIRQEDLESYRVMTVGGTPFSALDNEKFYEKTHGKITILQSYGMTEMSPLSHAQINKVQENTMGSCGRLIPNTQAKIVKVEEYELGDDSNDYDTGELLIRGPQVMRGYYNNPKATEETLLQDGWIRTGDIAYCDNTGQFYIKDRLKEMIKVKGYQVAPAEIEAVLRKHPQVEEVAVIGVPNEKLGEVPKAFIVPKSNSSVTEKQIQEYVTSKLVEYKHLHGGVVIMNNIPRNSTGKIARKLLKQL